jgi:hypothetical protein
MLKPHSAAQVRRRVEMVKRIVKHHFGKTPRKIEFKPEGKTNFVFDVHNSEGDFIVRIGNEPTKNNDFIK